MSDRYREENDRILRSAIRRYAQEEIGGIPSADELKEIQFSEDYCARREAILRCGGRPEQAEGGLWYADDSITSRNDAILREAFAAYCEEDNRVPSGEALENVAFSQAYQKRKKQILRAKGRPVDLRVVHSRKTRRILRVGIVAALIAVIAMSSVFFNMNSKQDFAGFEIDIENYFGIIESPTTPDGFAVPDTNEYMEQPDGTRVLPQQYAPSYIPADYALESYQCDGGESYIYRKDNAFLFWPGSYITFDQSYPGSTMIFYLENLTLEEIEVEGLGKCLYYATNKKEDRGGLMWRQGPYVFQVFVDNLPKDELIKIAKSTKLKEN